MKVRNGFVSNSSSSSFVLIGHHLTKNDFSILFENSTDEKFSIWDAIDKKYGLDVHQDGDDYYVGQKLYIEEDDYDTKVKNLDKITEEIRPLSDDLGDNFKLKFVTGVCEY